MKIDFKKILLTTFVFGFTSPFIYGIETAEAHRISREAQQQSMGVVVGPTYSKKDGSIGQEYRSKTNIINAMHSWDLVIKGFQVGEFDKNISAKCGSSFQVNEDQKSLFNKINQNIMSYNFQEALENLLQDRISVIRSANESVKLIKSPVNSLILAPSILDIKNEFVLKNPNFIKKHEIICKESICKIII